MFKKQHSVQFKYFEFFYDNFFNPDNEYLIDKPAIGKKISKEKENYITALYFILLDLETREQTKEVKEKLQTIYKICNTTIKNYEIIYKRYSDYIIYPPHIDFNNMSYDLLFLLIEKGKKAQAKISEKRENWYKTHNTALKKQEGKYARLFDSINNDLDNFNGKNLPYDKTLLETQLEEFKTYYYNKKLVKGEEKIFGFISALQNLVKFYNVKLKQDNSKKTKKQFKELNEFINDYIITEKVYIRDNESPYRENESTICLPTRECRITRCFLPEKLYSTIVKAGKKAYEYIQNCNKNTIKEISEL